MISLQHGQKIEVNGIQGQVGTIEGYAAEYNEQDKIPAKLERAKNLGHEIAWTSKRPVFLSDCKGHYEAAEKEYADRVKLENGADVQIEGRPYKVKFMGDYSDFVHFVPADTPFFQFDGKKYSKHSAAKKALLKKIEGADIVSVNENEDGSSVYRTATKVLTIEKV